MMKVQRQAKILQLIEQQNIETQEELTQKLAQCGFHTTQATISRDIKDLSLIKVSTENGGYKYVPSDPQKGSTFSGRLKTIFREGVISYASAQNIVVIKTIPGLAPAAGAAIDSMQLESVIGTISGDDTVMLVVSDAEKAKKFIEDFRSMLN